MLFDKNRIVFILFLTLPLLVSMIVPILSYDQITSFRNTLGVHEFNFLDLFKGLSLAGLWFLIVILGFSYKTKFNANKSILKYNPHSLWVIFLLLSSLSIVFHLFDSLFLVPLSYKNLLNVISKVMIVSIPLGIWVIKYHYQEFVLKQRVIFLIFFIAVLFEYVVMTSILATPSQSLMSILVICFSLVMLNYKKKTIVVISLALFLFIATSIGIKTMVRDYFYGQVFERTPVFNTVLKQVDKTNANSENYDMAVKIREQSISDPNFYNITLLPKSMHDTTLHYIVSQGLRRINHLKEFLYVIETTPVSVPYKGLSVYTPIVFIPVPRILFPDKPVNISGQSFGHDYHILNPNDKVTSININPIIEGWVAYGLIGVLFSSLIFVMFIRLLFHILVGSNKLQNYLIMSTLINATLISEASLYGTIGGMFWTAIVSFVLVSIMLFLVRRI